MSNPQIRFKNDTNDWGEKPLFDLFEKYGSGGTPNTSVPLYYNGNIPFLSITDISNTNCYIKDTEKHITKKGLDSCASWIVPKGSISLAMYASVGKVAILENDIATSQAFFNMVIPNFKTRDYIYHYLKKMEIDNKWVSLISTGTQANLNAAKIKNLHIIIPSNVDLCGEVASFFNDIDKLIQEQFQTISKLKKVKTAMLKLMFSDDTSMCPKLRFKGYTDAWEQ